MGDLIHYDGKGRPLWRKQMKNQTIIAIAAALALVLALQVYMVFSLHEKLNPMGGQNPSGDALIKMPPKPKPDMGDKFFDDEFFNNGPWSPYEEMQHMQDAMDKLFGKSMSRFHMNSPLGSLSKIPDVDLKEQPDHYLVVVNAPGADEASINVKLDKQRLYISIKTEQAKDEADEKNGHYRYRERFVGEFQRVLSLPGPVDASKMRTEYHNGVLTITVPKA